MKCLLFAIYIKNITPLRSKCCLRRVNLISSRYYKARNKNFLSQSFSAPI